MANSIGASVGRKGDNRRSDVSTVQTLLKKHGLDPGPVNGICGPKTIAAIVSFQKGFLRRPDGLIEVGGITWRKLAAGQPDKVKIASRVTAGYWSGDSRFWSQEKKLESLEPSFRKKVRTVLNALVKRGFQPKIFYGWRSVAVQQELFKNGKSKVRFSFHNAQKKDGTPNSYAADIIDKRWGWKKEAKTNGFWTALGEEAKKQGLIWGGDWKSFPDVAHIQGRQNSELSTVKRESGL